MVAWACIVWSLTNIFTGMTSSLFMVAILRAILGVSQAVSEPASYSIVSDQVSKQNMPMANSLLSGSLFLGGGLCALNIILINMMGWRNCLSLMGGVGLVIGVLSLLFMKEPERIPRETEVKDDTPIMVKFKNAFSDTLKNPVTRYCSLAAAFRNIGCFTCDYFMPLFFILAYPEYKIKFSIFYAMIQMFLGFSSTLVGGVLQNKLGPKYFVKISQASSLLALPLLLLSTLNFNSFYAAIGFTALRYCIAEWFWSTNITMM